MGKRQKKNDRKPQINEKARSDFPEKKLYGRFLDRRLRVQNLMKKLSQKGFQLKRIKKNQLITHPDPKVFDQWGFISEELPYEQLCLIADDATLLDVRNSFASIDK